ncbi:MAG TPA: YdcF family protein, partial [Alphaproteobacteria bacterium]|nr:YdcF family protein [Alphaproteobacteria bacterium]
MLATLALLVLAALPLGLMLVGPLEDRFVANPALPDRVDGIVVLGGAADEALSMARGQLVLGDAAERLLAFV